MEALLSSDSEPVLPLMLPDLRPDEPLGDTLTTQDLALDYIEGEVGRHDWTHNWKQHKTQHGEALKEKVSQWLNHYEIDHDPQGIIDYIDSTVATKSGKWR